MEKNTKFKLSAVIIFSLSHFTHDIYTAFLSPLLPVIIERLHLTFIKAGLLLPLFRAPALLQPLIGYYSDKGKVAKFLPLSLIASSLLMSFFATTRSYQLACTILFLTGISAAFYHAPALYLLSSVSGTRHGMGMSIFMTGGELARSLGPLYIVSIIQFLPEKFIPFASIPGIFSALILLFIIPFKSGYTKKIKELSLLKVFKAGGINLLLLVIISIFHGITMFSFTLFLPTYMRISGFKLFIAGSSLTALELSGAFGALIGGTISDIIGRKRFFLLSSISIPVLINLFLLSGNLLSQLIFLFITGVFMFSIAPVRYAFAQELVPQFKGTMSSFLMALSFFTTTIASILSGFMGDHIGLFHTFRIISLIPILTIPPILFLPKNIISYKSEPKNPGNNNS